MDYFKEYRKFISSYYFNEAIRITIGIALPPIILNFFGYLDTGLLVSLGAMAVSASDIPGPVHQRRNGMIASLLLIFLTVVIIGCVSYNAVLLGMVIGFLCFSMSMIGVYGARVNAIGFASLLIMVLSLEQKREGWEILSNAAILISGGVWYMFLSLLLVGVRPYRVIQQALGESLLAISSYLKTRSLFYDEGTDYDEVYKKLMREQEEVQNKQILLREMLFKSRKIVKESTTTGRALLIIFVESIDLFEKATTTFYNYESMHRRFDGTGILPQFKKMILSMTDELDEIGIAVQNGRTAVPSKKMQRQLKRLHTHFEKFISENRSPENLEALINLRKIMQALDDIALRLYTLEQYSSFDKAKVKEYTLSDNYDPFITHTDLDWRLLKENLSLRSNTFRHALRVSIATVLGFIVSHLLHLGHSYWVLLTILVILKPTYSLSRERNYQRLLGTVVGALVGIGLVYFVKSERALFVSMLLFMIATYSFMRTRYLWSVLFMTPYILIFFYLLDSKNFTVIIENRVIDTALGSAIAFLSTFILVPYWEKDKIREYMIEALQKSQVYFNNVARPFFDIHFKTLDFKLSRRDAFVALSNLSGAFSRMLNEPKMMQANVKDIHQFVVMVYTLNSHIASLSYFVAGLSEKYRSPEFEAATGPVNDSLTRALQLLTREIAPADIKENPPFSLQINVKELLEKRKGEIQKGLMNTETQKTLVELKPIADQFLLISRLSADIDKKVRSF
ncbi:MAG: FUSC family membrane protein [Niabella sp.]